MSIVINNNRAVHSTSNFENPSEKKAIFGDDPKQPSAETINPDSRLGESTFYGLMLKNSLHRNLAEKPNSYSAFDYQPKTILTNESSISSSFVEKITPLSRLDLGILPPDSPVPDDGSLT